MRLKSLGSLAVMLLGILVVEMPAQAERICQGTGVTRTCRNRAVSERLPFVGTRYFNFEGGSGTGQSLTLQSDGSFSLESQGVFGSSVTARGRFLNPLILEGGSGLLLEGNKIYRLRSNGQIAKGCKGEDKLCESILSEPVAQAPQTYELSFWPGPNAASDRRVTRVAYHPCGQVAISKVTKIPPINTNQVLQPEQVDEFSTEGKVIRQWPTPVDSYPIAIKGNQLLVAISQTDPFRLWIGLDGTITPSNNLLSTDRHQRVKCGNESGNSNGAATPRCSLYQDLESGRSRILKFDGVCT
jgi:hypothetical protein